MKQFARYLARLTITSIILSSLASIAYADSAKVFSKAELQEDLKAFVDFVKRTHPDINHTSNIEAITAMSSNIDKGLTSEMSLHEAWGALAKLNPIFRDAHVGLRRPVASLKQYEQSGGTLFPAKLIVGADKTLRFASDEWANAGATKGQEVRSINGIPADTIFESLAPLMRGNSVELQRLILELYFSEYFWSVFGPADRYSVSIWDGDKPRDIILPLTAHAEQIDDAVFTHRKLSKTVALLEVKTFDISRKDEFKSFAKQAFQEIAENAVDTLVIDIRQNGGGARDVSDILMAYLTGQPYSALSGVKARITEQNIKLVPGSTLGSVVALPYKQTVTPPADLANRYSGQVYVLIGPRTYSQAIAFASTIQDYELGILAGEATEGPANQTGQVQIFNLPNTGFEALAPLYIFTRASGDQSADGLKPDVSISHNPLDPGAAIGQLLSVIGKARSAES